MKINEALLFERSLLNCHTKGLHSFIFEENKGFLTRLFVTDSSHDLWKNHCGLRALSWDELSIAVHPHHVNIKVSPVYGEIWNVLLTKEKCNAYPINLFKYIYNSQILNERGGFEKIDNEDIYIKDYIPLSFPNYYNMKSSDLHTVFVERGKITAWIIEESLTTSSYDNITYSNADLTKWTPEGLYIKPTEQQIREILNTVNISV